jgi:nicotinamide-nucleotide amidase
MSERLDKLASELGQMLAEQSLTLATAESCTGGWVAKVVTDIPGSSAWFDRGFVTYGDLAKQEMLGVSAATLDAEGAVSEAVVREMALGALSRSRAQVALAISGIAGPAGGSEDKPVGTVWFAWALHGAMPGSDADGGPRPEVRSQLLQFAGDREEVRHQSVRVALERLLELLPELLPLVLPQVLPDSPPAPTQAGG